MARYRRHRTTGASGRHNGVGKVYLMHKPTPKNQKKQLKVGSSRSPKRRVKQVRKSEGTSNIKLVTAIKVPRMRSGEGKAQRAVERIGLKKDKTRGGATDWYKASSKHNIKRVANAVRNALRKTKRR